MNLTINDIIIACEGEAHVNPADENSKVTSVVLDSRLVTEGGVFVAQKGEKVDGHSFIGQVFEKGAALVIAEMTPDAVERIFKKEAATENEADTESAKWGNYIVVEDSLIALKKIAKAYREKLDIPFVGITGSVGKTSTKEFIAGVLSEKYNVLKTEGNFNNEIGVPLTLLKIREEHEAAVVEMGISDFGEMTRLTEMVRPDIAVITNIGQCHLENLKTRDGILKAKTEIFKGLRPGGRAVLFAEDDKLVTVGPVADSEPVFFGKKGCGKKLAVSIEKCEDKGLFGSEAELKLEYSGKTIATGQDAETTGHGQDAEFAGQTIDVKVPLPGYHMVVNAAAAAAVSILMGLSADQIKSGINNMKPISGRNSIVKAGDITLIDDCYNANPVSMKSSIDLLMLAKGEKIAILGDMFELGENEKQLHADVGEYAAEKGLDRLYCIGKLSENMFNSASETFRKAGNTDGQTDRVRYWETKESFREALKADLKGPRKLIPQESSVLVKASHGMHFEEISSCIKEL